MRRYLVTLFWIATVACAADVPVRYAWRVNWVFVTPDYLKKTEIPFTFAVSERDTELFSLSLTLEQPTERFGVPSKCEVIVSRTLLPRTGDPLFADVNAAVSEKNRKKTVEVTVPSENRKSVTRVFMFSRSDIERSLIRVHYDKVGYGGDVYWVLLGRFLTKKG